MNVLVVNSGSSSVKLSVVDDRDGLVGSRDLVRRPGAGLGTELAAFLRDFPDVDAAGHRVVHGGLQFVDPVIIDSATDIALDSLRDLAPLHNPPSLEAIRELIEIRPELTQVACFDTAFHATLPVKAYTYAVPADWRGRLGIRRFGFHGLSHHWASRQVAHLMGRSVESLKLVTAHIGSGASLAAVEFGLSVDTTMGFTPIDGLVMSTRSGSVDPGVILWTQRHGGLSAEEVERALESSSGLLGLSGRSAGLSDVIGFADAGDELARIAYEVYVYRIQTNIGAMTAALQGIDGLVFTGGAGEGSSRLRADVCAGLSFLGIHIDENQNLRGEGDRLLGAESPELPAVAVVHAREDLEIAGHVRKLLNWS
jgi:acetate kinase